MKKVLLLLSFFSCAAVFAAKAQSDSTLSSHKKIIQQMEEYCIATIHQRGFSKKFLIGVDYGSAEFGTDLTLKDSEDKPLLFNSTADCLNYMAKQGWSLVNVTTYPSALSEYYMRRPLNQPPAVAANQ